MRPLSINSAPARPAAENPAVHSSESQRLPKRKKEKRRKERKSEREHIRRNLTKSLTRGMGFLLRMSGILSIMISPPPGLEKRQKESENAGEGGRKETERRKGWETEKEI